jgi:hypothetical protein
MVTGDSKQRGGGRRGGFSTFPWAQNANGSDAETRPRAAVPVLSEKEAAIEHALETLTQTGQRVQYL